MTRDEFQNRISEKRKELIAKKVGFEQELIEAIVPWLDHAWLDQEENLVVKIKTASSPFKGLHGDEFRKTLSAIPWVVSADANGVFSYVTIRDLPETYITAIKPVIGFHE
jgi:hypothetical protein